MFATTKSWFAAAEDTAPEGKVESIDYEDLLSEPKTLWTAQIFPDPSLGAVNIETGNGVTMAPDGKFFMVTTVGATVYAYNAYSGENVWHYQPEAVGSSIARSHGSVVFSPTEEYMVYAIVDNENSLNPSSRIHALDIGGNLLWVSEDLEGVASGDPVVSSDGMYVFLTHNGDNKSNGYFTILDGSSGMVFYSASSEDLGYDPTGAYGPIGIFHNPEEGNYDPVETPGATISEGDFNTNDMLMWAQTPKPTDTSIPNGYVFGFQFPRDFTGNATDIAYFQMGNFERDFQTIAPPVMTNKGLSGYWGVSRSGFRGWTPKRFSRARSATIGFARNEDFPGQPIWAAPALSNDGPEPYIFGGSAARQFVRMNFDFSEQLAVATEGYVKTSPIVDGDERAVYYVESDTGTLHQAKFDDLSDNWNFPINFSVDGNMAITPKFDVIIIPDSRGVITALQVADIRVTESPSALPSDGPSMTPTDVPTMTKPPVLTTYAPTMISTTTSPVYISETVAPVSSPVADSLPVDEPVESPFADGEDELPSPTPSSATTTFTADVVAIAVVVSTISMM